MKAFLIDLSRCNGCYGCQIACKDEFVDNDWLPYSKSQPTTGQFWIKVDQKDQGQVPKVRVQYTPKLCMHCREPRCATVGGEAVAVRGDGLVIIDPEKAVGRKDIVDACPLGFIYWNEALQLPQKCTGCAHLIDEGKTPRCVEFCATGALRLVDEDEITTSHDDVEPADDQGMGSRVFYKNNPGLFIAGDVWDPTDNEIIEGAEVALTLPDGSIITKHTDGFGDFWFDGLKRGEYAVSISATGFRSFVKSKIQLESSLNIGDFPLERQE